MSKKLDINENGLLLLTLFTNGYDREYYIREISTYLPLSPGTAQTLLVRFEEKHVLASSQRGKIRLFRIKPGEISIQYFVLTEIYKKIRFMQNHLFIAEILTKIASVSEGIVVLFGSYAKGTATEDSDIDIFIAGTTDEQAVNTFEKMYGVEINTVVYPEDAFASQEEFDPLVIEVKKNHIAWKNTELFVREVMA